MSDRLAAGLHRTERGQTDPLLTFSLFTPRALWYNGCYTSLIRVGHAIRVAYLHVEGKPTVVADSAVSALDETAHQIVRRWIAFDAAWCRTCRVCETMCAIYHEGAARPALARIHVTFDEFPAPDRLTVPIEDPAAARQFVSAVVCLQCADAPCIDVCPTGALARDARTGAMGLDADPDSPTACIGCMRCRKACPWDVPQRHPERKVALKCDLCAGRAGGPVCVEMCPLSGKALRVEQDGEDGGMGVGLVVGAAR